MSMKTIIKGHSSWVSNLDDSIFAALTSSQSFPTNLGIFQKIGVLEGLRRLVKSFNNDVVMFRFSSSFLLK
jgi:hypothetical protein